MPDGDQRRQRLDELAQTLRTFDPAGDYFAATLVARDGKWSLRFNTSFAGWPEGVEPGPAAPELREPCPVDPSKMSDLWESIGQGWIAVDQAVELAAYFRLGGNALIAQDVATRYLAEFITPQVLAKPALVGFAPFVTAMARHRPSEKLRIRILKRDGYRCQLCGERPSLNEFVVLVVHHIKPFSPDGLTDEENLITICHTCHRGLDPHEDLSLYLIPGGHLDRIVGEQDGDAFKQAVAEYRRLAERALSR